MQCLSKLFQVLVKFLSNTFPKQLFYGALRKEQWAGPFVEYLVLNLLSAKNRQKYNVLSKLLQVLVIYFSMTFPKQVL